MGKSTISMAIFYVANQWRKDRGEAMERHGADLPSSEQWGTGETCIFFVTGDVYIDKQKTALFTS